MVFKIFLCTLLILAIEIIPSFQLPFVTFPTSESVLKCGDQVTVKFIDDEKPPTSSMSGIKVQFMTDQETQQIPLLTIVENLPITESQFDFNVPSVKELGYSPGKFYFLMFSDPSKPDKGGICWSSKFTVLEGDLIPITYYYLKIQINNLNIQIAYRYNPFADSSETTPPVIQMTPKSFLLGNSLPNLFPDDHSDDHAASTSPKTPSVMSSVMQLTPRSLLNDPLPNLFPDDHTTLPSPYTTTPVASTPTSSVTSSVIPITSVATSLTNVVMPAATTSSKIWQSVITAVMPTRPVTVVIPLKPTKSSSSDDPSSDQGTVIVVVNGPKSSSPKSTNAFDSGTGLQSSAAIN
ncbi:9287_t:CDS:2, partial [Cetraspora pellucida]